MTAPASKLLQPITVGPLELKNRIMFPPLTTGYEERDGSIGERSLAFYERLARGGVSYIVIGDVAPVMTASPTPKLATDAQIPTFKALADAVHKHGAKVALQLFHPEYDVPGVGRMVMGSMAAAKAAQEAKAAGDEETFAAKMAESNEIRNQAYAKLHHDMQHFVNEASVEQLTQIKEAIAASAARAQQAGIDAIEVHGDRLVGSLCSAILNQRTDEYGGSLENRARLLLMIIDRIRQSRNYNVASACLRQVSFGLLDMAYYTQKEPFEADIIPFEKAAWQKAIIGQQLPQTCMTTQFSHIMAGGYAAGYYSYKWAEVLAADAFSLFKEKGIFNPEVAEAFRREILSKGGHEHPMTLYVNFRGHKPETKALIEKMGLEK